MLTLLIHLGYLTWNEEEGTARIPNEEVRIEFQKILKGTNVNRKWMELLGRSEKLLKDTIAGDAQAVAEAIEEIRDSQYAPTETVHKLYEKFGYAYLNRDVYYIDSLGKERTRDDVMILGLRNKRLAEKILSTNGKFHYGKEEGCW